ncbi:hypothetical protein STENM223S_11778 [Streptomyces tendae]
MAAGRKRARSGKAYRQTEVAPDPAAVRAWAQANRMDVPARARIPKKVYEASPRPTEPGARHGRPRLLSRPSRQPTGAAPPVIS